MSGKDLHNKPEFDSVATPDWLLRLFEDFHDPFPLHGPEIAEPPQGAKVFVNPGYSRKMDAAEKSIEVAKAGHHVSMLVPIETSTQFGKLLIQYGVDRLYFEHRPFPNSH